MVTAVDQFFRDSLIIQIAIYLLAGAVLLVACGLAAQACWRVYREYHGTRIVTCPETEDYATIEVDAWYAAITQLFGRPKVRVRNCSRWPEHADCARGCTWQIRPSPVRVGTFRTH